MRTLLIAGAVFALAGAAPAQNINVDFMRTTGPGAGAPAVTYPGAAGQAGHWNGVVPSSTTAMVFLTATDGSTGPWMEHRASNGADSATFGGPGFANLMADYAFGFTQSGVIEMTFHGLEPGYYRVFVYAGLPETEAFYQQNGQTLAHTCFLGAYTDGNVLADSGQTSGWVGGDVFQDGVNYKELRAGVGEGGTLRISANANLAYFGAKVAVNGVQLVRWPSGAVHVRPTPTGDGTGRDWDNAMGSIQGAIDLVAASRGTLTDVWVAAGTYKPALNDRTQSFRLRPGVTLRGGFAGTEAAPEERDGLHPTVLSGNIGNVFSAADNSYTVVRFYDDGMAGLDRLTIRDGRANGPAAGNHNVAGGLWASSAGLTVTDCVFENNTGGMAGAVWLFERQLPMHAIMRLERCTFRGNSSLGDGGAICSYGRSLNDAPAALYLTQCRFQGNTAAGNGGALHGTGNIVWVNASLFNGNSAADGGAVYLGEITNFEARTCTFTNNHASGLTGGIAGPVDAGVGLRGSILWGNTGDAPNSTVYRQLRVEHDVYASATYSCIQGIGGVFSGNYTNVNPQFVDRDGPDNIPGTDDDQVQLADTSPLIDAGFDMPFELDLDGLPRGVDNLSVPNTGVSVEITQRNYVDMGCFENQSTGTPRCPADWNGDGLVNSTDISAFLTTWLAGVGGGTLGADFNADGQVNSTDISAFLTAWLAAVGGGC